MAARRRERRLSVARDFRPPPPAARALHADLAYRGLPEAGLRNYRRNDFAQNTARLANILDSVEPSDEVDTSDLFVDCPFLTEFDDQEVQELANLRANSRKDPPRLRRFPNPQFSQPKSSLAAVADSGQKLCFNCGSNDGHVAQACTAPRRVFCRGCSKVGRTRNNCDVCPPLGDQSYCTGCGLTNVTITTCPTCNIKEN